MSHLDASALHKPRSRLTNLLVLFDLSLLAHNRQPQLHHYFDSLRYRSRDLLDLVLICISQITQQPPKCTDGRLGPDNTPPLALRCPVVDLKDHDKTTNSSWAVLPPNLDRNDVEARLDASLKFR